MSENDARVSPYDLVFEAPLFQEDFFPRIAADERTHGRAETPAALIGLAAGEALLRAVLPEEALGPAAAPGRQPGGASAFVVDRYAALLFTAYRYWEADRPEYRFEERVMRTLLDAPPQIRDWSLLQAPETGYAALPKNLVWSRLEDADAAEPVDGLFWVRTAGEPSQLVVVLVLGVRAGRAGFSVLDVTASIPEAGHYGDAADSDDFANFLPGGELQHLFGVQTPAAALRLTSLLLWYVDRHPAAITRAGAVRNVAWTELDG